MLQRLAPAALCLGLAACSTRVPVQMTGPNALQGQGVATTTLYTGTFQVGGCRGNFTGPLEAGEAPMFVSCDGGRQGKGVAVLQDGRFVRGRVTWADGGSAAIIPVTEGPAAGPGRPAPR